MALRRIDGSILVDGEDFVSWADRKSTFKKPVIRGAALFFEMLAVGFRYLNRSAEVAMKDQEPDKIDDDKKGENVLKKLLFSWGPIMLAVMIALVVFLFIPIKLAELAGAKDNGFLFNLIAGSIRLVFFLVYLILIRLMEDIRRIFQYHGAEHKAVFAYESGGPVEVDTARGFSTLHPRCGTSFIMVVIILAVIFYGIVDMVVIMNLGEPSTVVRTVYHLFLLPVVGGLSYEVIRSAGKNQDNKLFQIAVLLEDRISLICLFNLMCVSTPV